MNVDVYLSRETACLLLEAIIGRGRNLYEDPASVNSFHFVFVFLVADVYLCEEETGDNPVNPLFIPHVIYIRSTQIIQNIM